MKNKRNSNFKKLLFMSLFFVFILVGTTIPSNILIASAVTVTGYSGVLNDLMIDDNFDKSIYPADENSTDFQIIQIAESSGGELFVYTYQPSALKKQFDLTQIAIAQNYGEKFNMTLYDLKLLDSDGVFAKYKVKDIKIKATQIRYYVVTEVFREFDESFGDIQPDNGNTITEVAIPIAKTWQACTIDGKVNYFCEEENVVTITEKYVGFVEYENGFSLKSIIVNSACHSHFVAFSTNYKIDDLYEADISYVKQQRKYTTIPDYIDPIFYGKTQVQKTLSATDEKNEYDATGLFYHQKYTWDSIQTTAQFIDSTADVTIYQKSILNSERKVSLTEESKEKLKNTQYVLRFEQTSYVVRDKKYDTTGGLTVGVKLPYKEIEDTSVTDVVILRLKFLSNGKVYNLGVIDNKVNGTGIADSETITEIKSFLNTIAEFFNKHKYIIWIIIAVVALIILGIFTPLLKFAVIAIVSIFKVLWYVISAPFVFIKSLFDKGDS